MLRRFDQLGEPGQGIAGVGIQGMIYLDQDGEVPLDD